MDKTQIFQFLTEVFRDVFDDANLTIAKDMTADDIKGWDSARMVELIIAAEMRFDLKFTSRETDTLGNVGDFLNLIEGKIQHA